MKGLTAKICWNNLESRNHNGPFIGYEYHLKTEYGTVVGRVGPNQTTFTTTFEQPTVAEFSVAAVNVVGVGDYTPSFKFQVTNKSKNVQGNLLIHAS